MDNEEKQNKDLARQEEIEKEERMRAEARAKIKREAIKEERIKQSNKRNIGCLAALGLFILFLVFFLLLVWEKTKI